MKWGFLSVVALVASVASVAGVAWPGGAQAQGQAGAAPANPPVRPERGMQFEWVHEGGDCRDRCRAWIAATGRLTDTSAADFEAFVQGLEVRGAMVALDSAGGLVDSGLALGRAFRRLGMTTTVGRTTRLAPDANGERRAVLSPRATCASMCVFALLGGVRRDVPDEARVLVHQIWPGKLRQDALAATYSAGNMVRIQRELGHIARYTVEMGADIELFELAMRIPPWESLRPLTRDELRRMRVHNADAAAGPAAAAAAAVPQGSAPVQRVAPGTVMSASSALDAPRGWTLTRDGGRSAVTRRHPLTVEGKEIGSFEVSFTCSEGTDGYQVIYSEKRLAAEPAGAAGTGGAADRLNGVRMMIQREPVLLKVESSGSAESSELVSSARGLMPAPLAGALAQPAGAGASLLVETITAGKQRTAIRMGPAGLAEGFGDLAASCPK
jgi:hypothetical protein